VIVHAGLAAVTDTPEIAIDNDEGEMLAKASANVLAQFDIAPDPKTQAIIGLVMACGAVYAPRYMAIKMRKAQQEKETQPGTGGVYSADGMPQGTTSYREQETTTKKGDTSFVEFDPSRMQ